jgi:2-polyprenyl-3-methyl-5-hydroxy-6-metoxy-1,4-benzoquinol methylase
MPWLFGISRPDPLIFGLLNFRIAADPPGVKVAGPFDKKGITTRLVSYLLRGFKVSTKEYVLGSSPNELERLILQDRMILRPITERLLRQAGLTQGMRVLDLGCGTGGVSLLAAEMVGTSGAVVGIDQSADAIAMAKERARIRGFQESSFRVSSVEEFSSVEPFDIVIGRYVLMYQPSPAAFIRAASRHVRPGGVVAFHEVALHRGYHSLPSYPAWEMMAKCLNLGFSIGAPNWDAAGRLVAHFQAAGLAHPHLFAELPVGGGEETPIYGWLAGTVRSLMPKLLEHGCVTEEEVSIDTLEDRLRSGAVELQAQVDGPPQVCAWVRI